MKTQILKNKKRKSPSQFNGLLTYQLSTTNSILLNFINFSFYNNRHCGPTENRTRNYQLTADCFTIKLLVHDIDMRKRLYKL